MQLRRDTSCHNTSYVRANWLMASQTLSWPRTLCSAPVSGYWGSFIKIAKLWGWDADRNEQGRCRSKAVCTHASSSYPPALLRRTNAKGFAHLKTHKKWGFIRAKQNRRGVEYRATTKNQILWCNAAPSPIASSHQKYRTHLCPRENDYHCSETLEHSWGERNRRGCGPGSPPLQLQRACTACHRCKGYARDT